MSLPVFKPGPVAVKPPWLKAKAPGTPGYLKTKQIVDQHHLHTVCREALCPNIGECWAQRTATFMIMGEYCSRACYFCSVKKGGPTELRPLDPDEPRRVGQAVAELGLSHAVVTSVTRDDVPDQGAAHFAATVRAIKDLAPDCKVELLIPDLQGSREHLQTIMAGGVDVLNHNLETVPRLYPQIRPMAVYQRSLNILKWSKELAPGAIAKSGIMVGLGEEKEEVLALMDDLLSCRVDVLTIGQYLRPSPKQAAIVRYVTPEEFKEFEDVGLGKGFKFVESAPLVRSSYHAWKHTAEQPSHL